MHTHSEQHSARRALRRLSLALVVVVLGGLAQTAQAQVLAAPGAVGAESQGQTPNTVRLRTNNRSDERIRGPVSDASDLLSQSQRFPTVLPREPRELREPDEFERFVSRLAGIGLNGKPIEIWRLGMDPQTAESTETLDWASVAQIPADYLVQPGDEVRLVLWGSVEAELNLQVDRQGALNIPRVGVVTVAGLKASDLQARIHARVAQTFRGFGMAVSMGQLRPVRVHVTGFVNRPGTYTLSALSTISRALQAAGGAATAGSYRNITLRRAGAAAKPFDLYQLMVKGDRAADLVVQGDDVIHVGAVGMQVALIGSVNRPAIFELLPGESLKDVIQMAGGLTPLADKGRLMAERLADRDTVRVTEWRLPTDIDRSLQQGDVLRAISAVSEASPQQIQNRRVRIQGEVQRPGTYVMAPGATLRDALNAAGGLTPAAYLFGVEFMRESVRKGQQENFDRALRDVETQFARINAVQRANTAEELASQSTRTASTSRLLERMRALRPTGRVVLELTQKSTDLPPLFLEDGDSIMVPTVPTSVGVFGSVFSMGNYLYSSERRLGDYIRLAGGATKAADNTAVFVIRANGTVVSASQSGGWFRRNRIDDEPALPGDTVFVPEDLDRSTFTQVAKDWTQILYQFGLGVAALKSLTN